MNLTAAFAASARFNAAKPALFWGEAEYGYELLARQSAWVAGFLARHGVQTGDRVGMLLKNSPAFIPALFGILAQGAVAVPINNFLKPQEISYILNDAGIDVVISERSLEAVCGQLQSERPRLAAYWIEDFEAKPDTRFTDAQLEARQADDLAVIIYTSGTTGRPKGALLSHGNLLHNVESCRQVLAVVDFDRFVLLLPMFHSFMLCVCIFLPLIAGGSIVLIKSLHPPKSILAEIGQRQATILPAIPQFFRTMMDASVPVQLPLRLCISGAAPLPGQVLREFAQKFPFPLLEGYGLSEASPVVAMNPIPGPWKSGSIGKPVPDVEVTIQDDAGRVLPLKEVGELCVRGGNVMRGYWNQPDETARTLRQGWLLTGDLGYLDEDGYIFITDRKKDMLLVNGNNVYPREIEEVLYHFPGVKEVAVVGQVDERKGEQPIAFVALQDGARVDERQLLQFARERLADYKVPRRVQFLAALPRNATGKILKTQLRKLLAPEP